MTAYALQVKNFLKIALSHTISKINAFWGFTQNFKMAAENGRKTIFGNRQQMTLQLPAGKNFFYQNHSDLYHF